MSPVDKYGKLNGGRPADIHESVERCADCPSCEQNVVDKNDIFARDVIKNVSRVQARLRQSPAKVIPVKSDVERTDGRGNFFHFKNGCGDPVGKVLPPRPDTDDAERCCAVIPLNDFM